MTHADWNVRIKRALESADRRPASSLRTRAHSCAQLKRR